MAVLFRYEQFTRHRTGSCRSPRGGTRRGSVSGRGAVGLSNAKFEVLSVLVAQDRPISLSELAEKLTCVRSNVTQLMDRLEADSLVKRTDDPDDRRAVRAAVTA